MPHSTSMLKFFLHEKNWMPHHYSLFRSRRPFLPDPFVFPPDLKFKFLRFPKQWITSCLVNPPLQSVSNRSILVVREARNDYREFLLVLLILREGMPQAVHCRRLGHTVSILRDQAVSPAGPGQREQARGEWNQSRLFVHCLGLHKSAASCPESRVGFE